MMIWFASLTLFLSSSFAEEVILDNVLVKGHGGQFRAQVVASKVTRRKDYIRFERPIIRTFYGEEYLLHGSGIMNKREVGSDILCKIHAPGWYPSPTRDSERLTGQAIAFDQKGAATVVPGTDHDLYTIVVAYMCTSAPVPSGE